jgi:exodeoxyribonuclease V beta subunit
VFVLQYHLYVLALHRYLGWRLGPAYDYDTHMGGAYYLFTRGMSKRWGPGFGIYRDRPTKALIERLDALMRGGA